MSEEVSKTVDEDRDEQLDELLVEEYLVLILAFDVYTGYVADQTGAIANDIHTKKGLRLLRLIDSQMGDQIKGFLLTNIQRKESQSHILRTFRIRISKVDQATRRALTLRTVLNRSPAATIKALFTEARARKGIRTAVAASMLEDPASALSQFSTITMRNIRARSWIEAARNLTGAGTTIQNPVETASDNAQENVEKLRAQQVQAEGATAIEDVQKAQATKQEVLEGVEVEATEAARQAMELSGTPDVAPVTKSEIVGIATAAATAVAAAMGNSDNIPDSLRKLDPEQRVAAMMSGKTIMAAGAGSGKTTTLIARLKYLVEEKGVSPYRIMAMSFNREAADGMKAKVAKSLSPTHAQAMMSKVDTMHSLFKKQVLAYGSKEQINALTENFIGDGKALARMIQKAWRECYDPEDKPPPKLSDAMLAKTQWAAHNISPAEAQEKNTVSDIAEWYEWYEGFKGNMGEAWKPPCEDEIVEVRNQEHTESLRRNPRARRYGTQFEGFKAQSRPRPGPAGDFDDQLKIFYDLLKGNPGLRKQIQEKFDHILVDECQDLNPVQFGIIKMITEHIDTDSKDRSLSMIGDDRQSIYGFRGADPEHFISMAEGSEFKLAPMTTNYRCPTAVVERSNQLIANNERQVGIPANARPDRPADDGSVTLKNEGSEDVLALQIAAEIKKKVADGDASLAETAILCRTRAEVNTFETACILRGVPYVRKGSSSFMGSPETKTILSYVQLATGDDYEKMQAALMEAVLNPSRFSGKWEAIQGQFKEAISKYAKHVGTSIKNVNPIEMLTDENFLEIMAEDMAPNPRAVYPTKKKLEEFGQDLADLQAYASGKDATTADLFGRILSFEGQVRKINPDTKRFEYVNQTLRETLKLQVQDSTADDDEDDENQELGNVGFLYELTRTDETEVDEVNNPPSSPFGFKAKMERLAEFRRDLRVDVEKWKAEQNKKAPDQRERKPPGVYLGTVHSVKGDEWDEVYVNMPQGKFPLQRPPKDGLSYTVEEVDKFESELPSERRLAYVAFTRAKQNLTVMSPTQRGSQPLGVSRFITESGLLPQPGKVPEAPGDVVMKTAHLQFIEDQD